MGGGGRLQPFCMMICSCPDNIKSVETEVSGPEKAEEL